MSSRPELYAGLMSGTSLDGVDGVLVHFGAGRESAAGPLSASPIDRGDSAGPLSASRIDRGASAGPRSANDFTEPSAGQGSAADRLPFRVLAEVSIPIPADLREELLRLQRAADDELARAALAANRLADLYAEVVRALLSRAGRAPGEVTAVGSHGQTVRHRPELGYTLQLHNPARLAEAIGIDVVADFRSRDVAAGGQGAPLVPAFHARAFAHPGVHRVVVNIGGIANLTDLPPEGTVRGWDTGPGNVLLDAWAQHCLGERFDPDGALAARGRVDAAVLESLLAEPWFARLPPKSTGRDLFDLAWVEKSAAARLPPPDAQATLTELTAATIADAIERHCPGTAEVLVCGGGVRNATLMSRLAHRLAPRPVRPTDAAGLPAGRVEAVAFAWLARCAILRQPGNLPAVTGARGPRVLGAIWPA